MAYAKTRGAAAVWGTCWEGDGAPGFWPWIQVVRALVPEMPMPIAAAEVRQAEGQRDQDQGEHVITVALWPGKEW